MKIVITGTSKGIGKALSDKFKIAGWDVIEYDILSGNDITKTSVINKLINDCKKSDVFINNAYPNQVNLLKSIYDLWKDQQKTIVNISSACTYIYTKTNYPEYFKYYWESKENLNHLTKALQDQTRLPYILNVRPGWTDTDGSKVYNGIKLKPEDLAELIYNTIIPNNKYQILDLVVR